jgi:hypothetical protein
MRMIRMYRHIKLLKRAGRGNIPNGILTTPPGGLALLCPACPQPGINLPRDWKKVDPSLLYMTSRCCVFRMLNSH